MRLKLGEVLFRAFVASIIANVLGSELIGLWVAGAMWDPAEPGKSMSLVLVMIISAPFLGGMWVVPFGTIIASALSPLSLHFAPYRTRTALIGLVTFGALAGLVILYAVALAISLNYETYSPYADALGLSQIYGPVFGGLTAAGWWWQLSQPPHSRSRAMSD